VFMSVLGWALPAAAYEDKIALSAGVGYAAWPGIEAPHGATFDLQVGIGLSPTWQLRGGAAYALHPDHGPALPTAGLRAEAVYMVDIVELVPFAGLGISALTALRDHDAEVEPAGHFVAGVAYWLSFDWLIELDIRAHILPDEIERSPLYFVSMVSLVLALDR